MGMTISDEAIEAAAMAILGVAPDVWAVQTTHVKDRYRWDAQAALQAAAPYLNLAPELCSACGGSGLADPEELDVDTVCPVCGGKGTRTPDARQA